MAETIYQPKGIIPSEGDTEISESNWKKSAEDFINRKTDFSTYLKALVGSDQNRRLYSERQFELFKKENWFIEDGWIKYELKRHKINEVLPPIQTFTGWSPSFDFVGSGFKLEDEIDLIKARADLKNIQTQELLEQNKKILEQSFDRLNHYEREFVVFRTCRYSPAFWDRLYFFSKGDF